MSIYKKKNPHTVRIMVFGTFDILHPGHLHFFKQARGLSRNPYLIVSIARDINVKRIKGQKPLHSEKARASLVKKTGLADRVVLGGVKDHVAHITKERPDIIALGYDQKDYIEGLRGALKAQGQIVTIKRLQAYKPKQFKSSIIKSKTYARKSRKSKARRHTF